MSSNTTNSRPPPPLTRTNQRRRGVRWANEIMEPLEEIKYFNKDEILKIAKIEEQKRGGTLTEITQHSDGTWWGTICTGTLCTIVLLGAILLRKGGKSKRNKRQQQKNKTYKNKRN